MLRGIRNASANWLGRAVMGTVMVLLAASFAVWGINDIFRGFGRSTLAKIGGTEIQIEQFRQLYNERLQQIGRQFGRAMTPEQANAFGLDRQVLSDMIAEAGLDQQARKMGLGLSDADVVRHITNDSMFQTNGQFDRVKFEQLLRSAGYSEQRFLNEQRRIMLRRQIIDSLTGGLPVPKAWLEAINEFQNQERSIEYVTLGPAQAGDIPEPTADELSKYFRRARSCSERRNTARSRRAGNTRGNRQIDGDFRRGHEGLLRRTPQPLRYARAPARRPNRLPERAGSRGCRSKAQRWVEFRCPCR